MGGEPALVDHVIRWEIAARDLDRISAFYWELFGWKTASFDDQYRLVEAGKGLGGGFMRCGASMQPYVTIYVGVDDVQATLTKVEALGGSVIVSPTPIRGVGWFALFQDPDGTTIGLLQMPAAA
jgi:uncharacterized protein